MENGYQFCMKCGQKMVAGAAFCPSCGTAVKAAPTASAPQGNVQINQQPYNPQPNYQQPPAGYASQQQNYSTQSGAETPFYCPQCGSKTVLRVKSGSDSSKSNVGFAFAFGLLGLMFKSAFGKEEQKFSGSLLDLACKTCGYAFPSQEEYSKAIGKHRRQATMGLILSIVLLCCALLLLVLPLGKVFTMYFAVFFKIFAVFCLILGGVALIAALILKSKLKDEEAQFAEHGRKINGIGVNIRQ